jgi:hypothetical protein
VQAPDLASVLGLVKDLSDVYALRDIATIPDEEIPALLGLCPTPVQSKTWARVRKGIFQNDLCYISGVDKAACTATVLIIPRTSCTNRKGKAKEKDKPRRPPPALFHPEQYGFPCEKLDDSRVKFGRKIFIGGLLEWTLSMTKLRPAVPTIVELEIFTRTRVLDPSFILRTWSECDAATFKPGAKVRVVEGEQVGLVGEISKITQDVITFAPEARPEQLVDVPLSSVRSHFRVGDYIQVKVGWDIGKFGCIIDIRYGDQADEVTFVDQASTKSGYPEHVSLQAFIVSNRLRNCFIRSLFPLSTLKPMTYLQLQDHFLLVRLQHQRMRLR